ncbi:MAG TPA: hypothetical protein VF407_12855, partial [Polyangiaceae bacterium]
GIGCGYHCDDSDDDRWPDAWCDLCQAAFEREGEWNERNEPNISVICTGCYETRRERNRRLPPPLVAGDLSVEGEKLVALIKASCERAKVFQEATDRRWGFRSKGKWFYDDETRLLRFRSNDDDPGIVADATAVGSFSTRSRSWMWVWGNAAYPEEMSAKVRLYRTFGEVRGIEKMKQSRFDAEEVDGWELTQIAAALSNAQAIYRAPYDGLYVFFLLDNFRDGRPT